VSDWKDKKNKLLENRRDEALREVLLRKTSSVYREIQEINDQVNSLIGKRKYGNTPDETDLFTTICEDTIERGADFICLDSFNAILGDKCQTGRKTIERILSPSGWKNICFLLIHHENAKGVISGARSRSDAFDHIYHLTLSSRSSGMDEVVLDGQGMRFTGNLKFSFMRRYTGTGIPEYTEVQDIPYTDGKNNGAACCFVLQSYGQGLRRESDSVVYRMPRARSCYRFMFKK
jgi:hypothetical protein